jgi:4'-phosphopantetheinyl transferase EntD
VGTPIRLSPRIQELFPVGAIAVESDVPGNPDLLLPAEREFLGRAVPKRVHEFSAGRSCARRALAELRIEGFAVRMAEDRQPVWPAEVCGSITHTGGFCAAVVARHSVIRSMGVDSETVGDVKSDILRAICLPEEVTWLRSLPAPDQAAAAALIFSAKEAFYKCQYPVVREALGFQSIAVEPVDWGAEAGVFNIRPVRPIALAALAGCPRQGHFLFHEAFVTTGIALRAIERNQ